MIIYVDTSTLLKLIVNEEGSDQATLIWDSAEVVSSCALLVVEARAALAAAERAGRLDAGAHREAVRGLSMLVDSLAIVEVTRGLIDLAADLAEQEALRGYDSVHLAGALRIGATVLTSADRTLCSAASRRGLHVANPLDD